MRSTLDLEKPILEGLKMLQKKEKQPLGKIASRLLADALAREAASSIPDAAFEWSSAPMGAKVDIRDKEALHRALDGA